jgi:hypothetical protein
MIGRDRIYCRMSEQGKMLTTPKHPPPHHAPGYDEWMVWKPTLTLAPPCPTSGHGLYMMAEAKAQLNTQIYITMSKFTYFVKAACVHSTHIFKRYKEFLAENKTVFLDSRRTG